MVDAAEATEVFLKSDYCTSWASSWTRKVNRWAFDAVRKYNECNIFYAHLSNSEILG
jgi:hypothetical protein